MRIIILFAAAAALVCGSYGCVPVYQKCKTIRRLDGVDSLVSRQLVTHYGDSIGFSRVYSALRDSLDSLDATVAGIRYIAARRIFITYQIAARELSYLYWNGHDNYPAFGSVLAEYIRAKASVEQRIIYWRKATAGMKCP